MEIIRTFNRPFCSVCNSSGFELYSGLIDRLYGASGEWNFVKCTNKKCNTIWINPAPIEEDLFMAYQNYYTHSDLNPPKKNSLRKLFNLAQESYLSKKYQYPSSPFKYLYLVMYFIPLRKSATDFKVMFLENMKGNILDIGCGNGDFLLFMKSKGWDVTGIDSDLKAVAQAQSKGLNVINGYMLDQKFEDNKFNAIVLSHLIEHLYDPYKILTECKRILKRNGKLVIATPNNASLGHFVFRQNWRGLEPPRHINIFSISSLHSIVTKSGLEETRIFTIPRIAADIFSNSMKIKSGQKNIPAPRMATALKIFASFFATLESWLNIFFPSIGEEIILIAKKKE
ncbi:MAG: class I SAM-dependent methyltransferase [Ignavibacteriota bacterium]